MKKIIFLLVFLIPLFANAQVRTWQISSKDTTGANTPAGTKIESDGNGSFIFVDDSGTAGADSIFTVSDYTFPIEYLKYTVNGDTVQVTDIPKPDGVRFPGYVTHQSGLTFNISAAAYYINGELYTSPSTTVTLATADATYDRIDQFVVDTTGQAYAVTGTPSATPIQPQYDPTSQLPLIPMGVDANATTPTPPGGGSISSEIVYDENTEWTTSASGVTVDFNQTTTVHNGTIAAEGGTLSNGDYISFTSATAVGLHVYETFSFWLKLKEALWMKDDIIVQLYSSGNPIGQMVNIDYNYQTTDWQFVSINVADFGTTALFNEIRITNDLFKATSPAGWYIDYVKLQGGIEVPVTVGEETDPVFSAHIASSITSDDTTRWGTDNIGTDDQIANEIPVTDAGDYFTGTEVETILQEIGEDIATGGDGSSPLTNKGDVYTFSTADARLPVGEDGYVLKANSSTPTGLEWGAESGGSGSLVKVYSVACSDEITDLTTGVSKVTFRMPFSMTVTEIRASVTTAPTGSTLIADINEDGISILSTKLSIDAGEKTSTTATSTAVIGDTSIADDAEITIDIDQIGSTVTGAGLKIMLIGN